MAPFLETELAYLQSHHIAAKSSSVKQRGGPIVRPERVAPMEWAV